MRYKEFEIIIERKDNRNLYLRLKDEKTLQISAPMNFSDEKILRFIIEKEDWIYKAVKKKAERMEKSYLYRGGEIFYVFGEEKHLKRDADINKVYKEMNKELLKQAEVYVDKYRNMLLDYHYDKRPVLKLRKMTSKWGVCYTRGNSITLNSYLIHYPLKCLEYVVLHEMVHFIVPNHSDRFYHLIEMRMPNYKEIKKKLV